MGVAITLVSTVLLVVAGLLLRSLQNSAAFNPGFKTDHLLLADIDLRRLGYAVSYNDGYQLQEALRLDGPQGPRGLGGVYEQQIRALRAQVPAELSERVEEELEAEAPASLASLIATVLERRLR